MDHRRFDALARALARASSRRAALGAALAALWPLVADSKRKPNRKGDRPAKDRKRSGRAGSDGRATAETADGGERAPSGAACLAVGQQCGRRPAQGGKKKGKGGKNRKRTPCTKCCSRHAVAQSNGTRRCACKPAGTAARNAAQCCSGRLSAGGFCGACDPGLTECGGRCVELQSDAAHCGRCGNACAAGQQCLDGACACDAESCPHGCCDGSGQCRPGTANGACGTGGNACSACAAPDTCGGGAPGVRGSCGCTPDANACAGRNCGTVTDRCGAAHDCGPACGDGFSCTANVCTCPNGNAVCEEACCDAGEVCRNATGSCCAPEPPDYTCAGKCGPVPNNCGVTVDCTARCGGCCYRATCRPGAADGMCGKGGADCDVCAGATPICANGVCTACSAGLPCPGGLLCCGGACVGGVCCAAADCDPVSSNACVGHACACGAGGPCSGATPTCCGTPGSCTDTATDPNNCGACGHACAAGQHCYGGACAACHAGPLQAAVDAAASGATVRLCPGAFTGADARAVIAGKDLTIVGAGDGADPGANTLLRPGDRRAFFIESDATVTIRRLRVEDASVFLQQGAAVLNAGTLTLEDCTLANNEAQLSYGGAIDNPGVLTLTRCTVTGNRASSYGGGIAHWYRGLGSPPYAVTGLTITDSTIAGNTADNGGGVMAIPSRSNILIKDSTISGNTADNGGGILLGGSAKAVIAGCTVSGNRAARGGGIANGTTETVLVDTDVTGNTATEDGAGGGLYQEEDDGSIALEDGSEVSGNTGGNCVGSPIVLAGGTCAP